MRGIDGDVREVWDAERPRPHACPGCAELARQLAATLAELRWRVESHNALLEENQRLVVLKELAAYPPEVKPRRPHRTTKKHYAQATLE